jgi:hypothetical protein
MMRVMRVFGCALRPAGDGSRRSRCLELGIDRTSQVQASRWPSDRPLFWPPKTRNIAMIRPLGALSLPGWYS